MGAVQHQIDLKLDYKRNIERYPLYQAFFRERQPKLLAIWEKNDPFFAPPGAEEAFWRDIPAARIVLLDTRHFALETEGGIVADEIRRFLLG